MDFDQKNNITFIVFYKDQPVFHIENSLLGAKLYDKKAIMKLRH